MRSRARRKVRTQRPPRHSLGSSAYLEDVPPFEAQLVVCSGFEVILGDGFHSARCSGLTASRGKGVFPAEAAGGAQPPLCGPLRLRTQCRPGSAWIRRRMTERVAGLKSPALPIGQRPSPHAPWSGWLSPPPSLPGRALISFLFSASGPGDWQARRPMASSSRTHFLFLPAGRARAGTAPAGVPLGSHLPSLAPYPLLQAQNRVP